VSPSHTLKSPPRPTHLAEWGATKKEVERSNFFLEVPKIIVRFRVALIISLLTLAAMIVLAMPFMPPEWSILGYQWSGVSEHLPHMKLVIDTPKSHLPIGNCSHLAYPVPSEYPFCHAVCAPRACTDPLMPADCTQPLVDEVVSGASLDQKSAGLTPVS